MSDSPGDDAAVDALYQAISGIGEDAIKAKLAAADYAVITDIIKKARAGLDSAQVPALLTGLLHYLLAVSLVKSQRKVTHDGVQLDIVVPGIDALLKSPDSALVVAVVEGTDGLEDRINEILRVQPDRKNVWLVSDDVRRDGHTCFNVGDGTIAGILESINGFVGRQKPDRLKIHRI